MRALQVDYENRQGQTALIVAASSGNVSLMDTLIECGAEVCHYPTLSHR
jgi:ankyrin repeat protein